MPWRQYLAALPHAEDSYPECLVKGSVVRALSESSPTGVRQDFSELPTSVRELIAKPPLPNVWLSEVKFNVLVLAHQERFSREAADAWVYERNRQLFASPLYRMLFFLVSPERLFVGVSNRWSAFRRGSTLELVSKREKNATLVLHFPAHLHNEMTVGNFPIALRAASEAAGAKKPEVRITALDAVHAEFETRWE